MFGLATKKEVEKSFKERDEKIDKLKDKVEASSLKIATLEGFILNKSQVSVSSSLKQSQGKIETKLIQRLRKSKQALCVAEIVKLSPSHTPLEIFEIIVKEKGLCSKASFYRYLASLKSQNLSETETNLRLKDRA